MLEAGEANDYNTLQMEPSNDEYHLTETADQILSNVVDMSRQISGFVVSRYISLSEITLLLITHRRRQPPRARKFFSMILQMKFGTR
jgi:hypothetical protein